MIQTGCNTSELQRLRSGKVHLEHEIPHIIISGETKTTQRKRVIPIVVGLERLQDLQHELSDDSRLFLGEAFGNKNESNVSHQLKTIISKVNPKGTAYSLRHAMRNNALASGVDQAITAMIGGWSSKLAVNPIQQQYGAGGRVYLDTLKQLQQAMFSINNHLIDKTDANIVTFQKRKQG